jgi:hypothetical protein
VLFLCESLFRTSLCSKVKRTMDSVKPTPIYYNNLNKMNDFTYNILVIITGRSCFAVAAAPHWPFALLLHKISESVLTQPRQINVWKGVHRLNEALFRSLWDHGLRNESTVFVTLPKSGGTGSSRASTQSPRSLYDDISVSTGDVLNDHDDTVHLMLTDGGHSIMLAANLDDTPVDLRIKFAWWLNSTNRVPGIVSHEHVILSTNQRLNDNSSLRQQRVFALTNIQAVLVEHDDSDISSDLARLDDLVIWVAIERDQERQVRVNQHWTFQQVIDRYASMRGIPCHLFQDSKVIVDGYYVDAQSTLSQFREPPYHNDCIQITPHFHGAGTSSIL